VPAAIRALALTALLALAALPGLASAQAAGVRITETQVRAVVDKVKANGFKMITRSEVAATQQVVDDIASVNPTTSIAFALGPDDVKVELLENKTQTMPVMLHHVHFFGQQNADMRAWYAKVFGATANPANPAQAFVTDQLPGVTLSFSPSQTPTVATQGRALDHIGFEIRNLEAFTKKLEAAGIPLTVSYRKVDALNLSIAFIKDPWGTNIEMTEGLVNIK